ncbi:oxysterol-binding protein-related protein 7 isoform X3 [Mus musculus]|uniref:oxysterol-binding protein-related protein 7 isoform X3 n=1 Tax=Mus musculus TaxID=10090 RepID=UPI0005AB98F6|nr:oxysterol-binding protein-related protein 7 isoform X3 [Mus musculus]|eukprot:XP_011247569.1 PREDICTED: oxysterol-binding protein-related protein 7 isoform X3 [Mus musculus]
MPSGDCAPHFQVIWYHSVLSPPESRGAELSGSPELGGRRQRRRGRWGDPAGGEAPTSPSFLVPAVAAATAQFCEELAGDSETVSGTAAYGSRGSGVHGSWGFPQDKVTFSPTHPALPSSSGSNFFLMDFQERDTPSLAESTQSSKPSSTQQASELWEVMEEPRGRLGADDIMPERQEGHLLKKRKWPLKGWHKRYFVLEDGILHYATTRQDITKGKVHGSIDVRLSVMSINKKAQRIDLDTEDNIYHLKIKSQDLFHSWVAQLRAHRLAQRLDMPSATHRKAPGTQMLTAGSASALPGVGPREKVSSWLRDSDGLDRCSHALSECQGKLQELHRLLQSLESLHRIPSAPVIPTHQTSVTTERPKKGKRTSRMWCTQGFAKDDTIGRVGRLHGSVPNLSRYLESRDTSGPRGLPPPDYAHLQRSFWALAQKVHNSLSSVLVALTTERDRLRDLHQGSELSRMVVSEAPDGQRRLHSLSISSDTTADSFSSLNPEEQEALYMKGRELTPQLSQSSVLSLADSHTEFFDACEVLLSASSSENEGSEEEESCASEITTSLSEEVLDIRGADRYQKGDRGKDETQAQLLCSCVQQWNCAGWVVLSPAAHAHPQDITSSQMPQSPPIAGNAGMP